MNIWKPWEPQHVMHGSIVTKRSAPANASQAFERDGPLELPDTQRYSKNRRAPKCLQAHWTGY